MPGIDLGTTKSTVAETGRGGRPAGLALIALSGVDAASLRYTSSCLVSAAGTRPYGIAGDPPARLRQAFVAELTDASIATRYPDDLARMVSRYPESVARSHLQRTEEVISWLASDPRLQPPSPAT